MKHPERQTQGAIVSWLRAVLPRGSLVSASMNEAAASSPNAIARSRYYQRRRKAGVLSGWPDLIICIPDRVLFVETKRPKGGVVSDSQQGVHAALRTLGHPVGIVTDIESCRWFLIQEGVPTNETPGQPAHEAKFRLAKRTNIDDPEMPF